MDAAKLPLFMDDPNWAAFIKEQPAGNERCRLPAHEDCAPADPDAAAGHLAPGGTLGTMPGYEARPGQLDVLRAVVRAFNGREHLMIEAGTGVGKSLAYLVPSVLWSWLNDTPVVISTATRNLQSQLLAKDLPRAVQVLGEEAAGKFRATALKGRANYVCLRALEDLMHNGYFALDEDERETFGHFADWLHATEDGDLDTADAELLRGRVSCPGEDCYGRRCKYFTKCFVQKARGRAMRAHLIVANHSLVISEAAESLNGLLPAYGRLVLDEAHNLEDIATDLFSYEFSRRTLGMLLGKLSRKGRGRRTTEERGLLGNIERQLRKGDLGQTEQAGEIRELAKRAAVQMRIVAAAGDEVFEVMEKMLRPAKGADVLRFRCRPQRQYSARGLFADYRGDEWNEAELQAEMAQFEKKFAALQNVLGLLAREMQAADDGGLVKAFGDMVAAVRQTAGDFTAYLLEAKFVLSGEQESHVYWVERMAGERRRGAARMPEVRAVAAPLSVAQQMHDCFYKTKDSVVLCSATLRTGDKFDYMARRLGVTLTEPADRWKMLVAQSPFNYLTQALAMAADWLPDPSGRGEGYVPALAELLAETFGASRGRGLALFTSYDMMRKTAEEVREAFGKRGLRLLVQGEGMSREAMTEELKAAGEGLVLFGAQSFWEGVDVPGEALSCVVLARLPFPQVGEPIVEARSEQVTVEGGSAFRDYMLPEALIKFRQGFGRLVRARSDRGVVVIADPRVAVKNYGALFRRAAPASVHTVSSIGEAVGRAKEFFGG